MFQEQSFTWWIYTLESGETGRTALSWFQQRMNNPHKRLFRRNQEKSFGHPNLTMADSGCHRGLLGDITVDQEA
jgi:hypothetical protein